MAALQTVKKYILADVVERGRGTQELITTWAEADLDEYVLELCGDSLEHLSREPAALAVQEERYLTQLEDVSCGNYRALIEGFECAGAVRQHVGRVRGLDALVDALPELATATRAFSKDVGAVQRARARQLRTAHETARVLDLLEVPRLMRALLRDAMYDEAVALREHAAKLRLLHARQPLVAGVCKAVDALTVQMVAQLLGALRGTGGAAGTGGGSGPPDLAACLRVVGWLRRIDVFPENTLRMQFLHCRAQCMRAQVRAARAGATTAQGRLVALCDATRAVVFEIVTQYRAVFADDPTALADSSSLRRLIPLPHVPMRTPIPCCMTGPLDVCGSSSPTWRRVSECISDGAALRTVLQQAMSCGQSLGRVGGDFRPALPPLFHAAVRRVYAAHLVAARTQFEAMLEDSRWAPVGSSAKEDKLNGPRSPSASASASEDVGDTLYEPPRAVLDSPPLAVFLNGILAAFNDLRLCAPKALGRELGAMLENTMIEAAKFMSGVAGPGGVFLKRADRNHFKAMITSLRDLALPHAARCLEMCMAQSGLVRVSIVSEKLTDIFGVDAPADVRAVTTPDMNGASLLSGNGAAGLSSEDNGAAVEGETDKNELSAVVI